MIIDFHAHLYPRAFMEEVVRVGRAQGIALERGAEGVERLRFEGITFWAYEPSFWDVQARIASLDAAGVDLQVLSMGPPMVYWAAPDDALRLCQILNDAVSEVVKEHPNRFAGFIALPFQAPELALQELQRAHGLGLVGVAIGSNIHGRPLDDQTLWPIYEQIERADLPLFIHPINPIGQPGIHDFRLDLSLGFPFDTTLAAARLVFGGVMERFPNLKVCLAHLGGALPYLQERVDIGWRTSQVFGGEAGLPRPPSDYFRRFYLDCLSYSDPAMLCALALYGADHIVLGSDAPFAVGDLQRSVDYLSNFAFATQRDRDRMLGETAATLLKLSPPSR
jgi:aminocarboxymuconate-semialdehyde decarboxylase